MHNDDETIVTAGHRLGRRVPDLIVHGKHESEILGMAPAMVCDRIHWESIEPFDMSELVAHLGPDAYTRRWSDGQQRIWVPAGAGYETRDLIRDWCEARGIEIVNARVETSVPFRDLDAIPGDLMSEFIAACVDWLYVRSYGIRRKLVTELELIQDEDVRSLMYLFVHDHADRFDADRTGRNGTLNFTAFMFGKMRTWPQDAARAAYGRTLVSDRIALHRTAEAAVNARGALPSVSERADALGVSVTELRRRESAISTLSEMRNYHELVAGESDAESIGSGSESETAAVAEVTEAYSKAAAVTRGVLNAVTNSAPGARRAQDSLAFASIYLTFWEGMNRAQAAKELEVLPKTAAAALNRAFEGLKLAELR